MNTDDINQIFEIKLDQLEINRNMNEYLVDRKQDNRRDLNEIIRIKEQKIDDNDMEFNINKKLNNLDIIYEMNPLKLK